MRWCNIHKTWYKSESDCPPRNKRSEQKHGRCTTSTKTELLRVEISDGKYTVILSLGGDLYALRYGEHWRNLIGDKLILAMAQEIAELRETQQSNEIELEHYIDGA